MEREVGYLEIHIWYDKNFMRVKESIAGAIREGMFAVSCGVWSSSVEKKINLVFHLALKEAEKLETKI